MAASARVEMASSIHLGFVGSFHDSTVSQMDNFFFNKKFRKNELIYFNKYSIFFLSNNKQKQKQV